MKQETEAERMRRVLRGHHVRRVVRVHARLVRDLSGLSVAADGSIRGEAREWTEPCSELEVQELFLYERPARAPRLHPKRIGYRSAGRRAAVARTAPVPLSEPTAPCSHGARLASDRADRRAA